MMADTRIPRTDRMAGRPTWDPMATTAGDVMSAPVVTLTVTESLATAWDALFGRGIHHLVVTSGTRVVGVLDDRTLALEWPVGPLGPHRRRLRDVLPPRVHCVLPSTPVAAVARIMADERLDAVPVVYPDGAVTGIITSADVVRFVAMAAGRYRAPSRDDPLASPGSGPLAPVPGR